MVKPWKPIYINYVYIDNYIYTTFPSIVSCRYLHVYVHIVATICIYICVCAAFTFSRKHGTRIPQIYTHTYIYTYTWYTTVNMNIYIYIQCTCLSSRRFVRAETQSAVEEREGRDPVWTEAFWWPEEDCECTIWSLWERPWVCWAPKPQSTEIRAI